MFGDNAPADGIKSLDSSDCSSASEGDWDMSFDERMRQIVLLSPTDRIFLGFAMLETYKEAMERGMAPAIALRSVLSEHGAQLADHLSEDQVNLAFYGCLNDVLSSEQFCYAYELVKNTSSSENGAPNMWNMKVNVKDQNTPKDFVSIVPNVVNKFGEQNLDSLKVVPFFLYFANHSGNKNCFEDKRWSICKITSEGRYGNGLKYIWWTNRKASNVQDGFGLARQAIKTGDLSNVAVHQAFLHLFSSQ